jgi:hypothetical protein
MAQPKRAVRKVEDNEGDLNLMLYQEMLNMVKDIQVKSLEIESGEGLAEVLYRLGMLQGSIERVVEKIKEERDIAKATEVLLSKEDASG